MTQGSSAVALLRVRDRRTTTLGAPGASGPAPAVPGVPPRGRPHLAEGLATTVFVFPWVGSPRNARDAGGRASSCGCSTSRRRIDGAHDGIGGHVLIVANHVSWLDIFVLNALQPARFVAKAELARWP